MSFWKWSTTASSNATADGSVNWAEGQAPSSVNDSARAMMAAAAKYRKDVSGTITTGGSASAYTATSNQTFDSLANMSGNVITVIPHATNDAAATLNVDSLGAKTIRTATGVAIGAGVMVQGTPYSLVYFNSNNEFILLGFAGDPFNVPIGGLMPYLGSSAPNSSFVLPYGQAISRTTYATLFSLVSTTFGTGDGTTTFNVPDLRGRVVAGYDSMGGSSANRLTNQTDGVQGDTIGATGGTETHTLTAAQMAAHTHTQEAQTPTFVYQTTVVQSGSGITVVNGVGSGAVPVTTTADASPGTTGSAGGDAAHNNVQPTIVLPFILRVI